MCLYIYSMIINEKTEIKIHPSNFRWFKEKGYYPFKKGDVIEILIEDLKPNSKHEIEVKCEICSEINFVKYQNYNIQVSRGGYYVCFNCSKHKQSETNMDRYGSKSPLRNKDIIKKTKETLLSKYGVDNISKLESIKEDRRDNFKSDEFKEKARKTWLSKYGVDNPSKSEVVKQKKIETTLGNYGVENPTQNIEIFEKQQKSQKKFKQHKIGIGYRGTYEKDFLDYCHENDIKVDKGITIKIGDKKYYHSDFYLSDYNLICEIKSDYYFYKYHDLNLLKREKTIDQGYNFLFIINKKYFQLNQLINSPEN